MERPDPDKTLTHIISWTLDDLIFLERAYWRITARYANGFPSAFKRLPAAKVSVKGSGLVSFDGGRVEYDPKDIVEFAGTGDGVLVTGARAIGTALRLDEAAERYADVDMPTGYLKQTDGEELSPEEAVELGDTWEAARRQRRTAVLPEHLEFHPVHSDPEKLQLLRAREHSALECARLMSVPPWSVGVAVGGMTYQNVQQARADLIDFGTRRWLDIIEDTLSGPNVTPRGTYTRFDLSEWLANPFNEGSPSGAPQNRSEDTGG
jgi:hypothetical protein